MTQTHRAALSAIVLVGVLSVSARFARPDDPAPEGIAVRYAEGTVHGFLDLRTSTGELLASGDLFQIPKDDGIESRLVFRFADSSLFEETASYTQHHVFALRSYHLVQRGPAFKNDIDASLAASGEYVVTAKSRDGKEKHYQGHLDVPADVSNGIVIVLLKNIPRDESRTVHVVAFTPQPRLVGLELTPQGEERVLNGQGSETAVKFVLKPRLGSFVKFFARLAGKLPPDSHAWIVTHEVPMFVRFEGPLYSGPVWRIDLSSPRWPR